jgi:hypothetical protein
MAILTEVPPNIAQGQPITPVNIIDTIETVIDANQKSTQAALDADTAQEAATISADKAIKANESAISANQSVQDMTILVEQSSNQVLLSQQAATSANQSVQNMTVLVEQSAEQVTVAKNAATNAQGDADRAADSASGAADFAEQISRNIQQLKKDGGRFFPTTGILSLTTIAQEQLGTSDKQITLTNDQSPITGFIASQGMYYASQENGILVDANGTVVNDYLSGQPLEFVAGDWLCANASGWYKEFQGGAVAGVKGGAETIYRYGYVNITKENIGLGNVNNTSDIDKPVSTAQQAVLDLKQNKTDNLLNTINKTIVGAINEIFLKIYPVGSIYITVNNEHNTATAISNLFGGTWVQWGMGRTIIGMGVGEVNDYLTIATPPSQTVIERKSGDAGGVAAHTHSANSDNNSLVYTGSPMYDGDFKTSTDDAGSHTGTFAYIDGENYIANYNDSVATGVFSKGTSTASKRVAANSSNTYTTTRGFVLTVPNHNHNYNHNHIISSHTHPVNVINNGTINGNMPPYITCYMWKRIS